MLQRLTSPLDEELRPGCGLWSRDELEEMNDRFVATVLRAFQSGQESLAAASATVRIGSRMNGTRPNAANGKGASIARAFDSAWDLMVERKGEVSPSEIVSLMQTLVPGISSAQVRLGFAQRFKQRGVTW